jgi:selenide,water dikinase
MLRESGVSARVQASALPVLDGALELLARGVRSTYHEQNAYLRSSLRVSPALVGDPRIELLFDPQTSGGLLFGVDPARVEEVIRASESERAQVIGEVLAARTDGAVLEII